MLRPLLPLIPLVAFLSACPVDDAAGDDDDDDGPELGAGAIAPDVLEAFTSQLASDALEGRDEGTLGGQEARRIIVDKLTECGVEPAGVEGFEQEIIGGNGTNILGRVVGTSSPERVVIVSAHYDHIGVCSGQICNGAYDNAGGVSAAVGVACEVAGSPAATTLLVALWDAEEPPTFLTPEMGSEFFAQSGHVALDDIDAVLVLDLVGGHLWPGYQSHFVMGAEKSPALSAVLDTVAVPRGLTVKRGGIHLVENTPFGHQPWSDYDGFRNRNVPFAFFSDGQNKLYHTVGDEADTLDYDKLSREAEHLRRVVEAITAAGADGNGFAFDSGAEELERDQATVTSILDDALAPGGLVESLGLSQTTRSRLEQTRADAAASTNARTLETGALRVMCYAGGSYDEETCGFF